MKKLFIKSAILILIWLSFFSINITSAAENHSFEITPYAVSSNIWTEVNNVWKWWSVWDKYKEASKDENMTLWDQFVLGIITWDIILDYVVYLVKFIGQIILLLLCILIIWSPVWIILLIWLNRKNKNQIDLSWKYMNIDIYDDCFDVDDIKKSDIKQMKRHCFDNFFSTWLIVFLHIITFWLFSIVRMWLMYDLLPKINEYDFWSSKAIWFLFIPIFNIYWAFVFRLKLVNRINFQYKLRSLDYPISKKLAIITLIMLLIPILNVFSFLILKSILLYQIQSGINWLVDIK
jgi:hypothetical protein